MTEEKKPEEPEKEIETLEEAEAELKDIEKYEITPEQEKEVEELKEEIPKGKILCPICNKLQNTRGFNNHLDACKRKQEEKEGRSKYKINDKLPPGSTSQEKKDVEAAQRITNEYLQQMQPLAERQDLRNEVAVEQLETQRQNVINKREGMDDLSWKDIINLKKVEAMEAKKSGGNNEFIAMMNMQMQNQNQMFQMQMKAQEQSHQRDMNNQKTQFDFMTNQLETNKKEHSALGELAKFKELAKDLDYEKSGESAVSKVAEVLGSNIKHIPEIVRNLKNSQKQTYIPPTEISPNPVGEQTVSDEAIRLPVPQQVSGVEPNSNISNVSMPSQPQPPAQQMTDQQIKDYAKTNYVEQSGESPFVDMYVDINANQPQNKSSKMTPNP